MRDISSSYSSLYTILYVSYASKDFSHEELEALWKQSAAKNMNLNLTGMLLYLNDRFIQVLEGEKSQVKTLYHKITKDKRHERPLIVLEDYISERNFENWSMGFYHVNPENEVSYISAGERVLGEIDKWQTVDDEHPVLSFLKLFYNKQNKPVKSHDVG